MTGTPRLRLALLAGAVAGLAVLPACSSSKPGYCADRTNLQNSVKGLASLNPSSGVSGLKSQVSQIQSSATKLVNSAKSDFPSQTSAITSSVTALQNTVSTLGSNPSAAQISALAQDAGKVVQSVSSFMSASNSACG